MLYKFDTESAWLEARKKDITSTEVAALLGMSQYKSRLRLFHEKAGHIESDFTETQYSKWGRRLQNAIGQGIAEDEGYEAFDLTGYYLRDEESRIGASMDMRVVCPERGEGLLEVKSTGFFEPENGWEPTRAPVDYEFQLATQINLAIQEGQPITWGCIGALDGRKNTRLYHRKPDSALWDFIKQEAAKFWHSIAIEEPPAPDYAVDAELIRMMQGPVNVGQNCSLTGNNRAHELMEEIVKTLDCIDKALVAVEQPVKDANAIVAEMKAEIHHMAGNADTVIIGDYRVNIKETTIEDRLQKGYKYRRFDIRKMNQKRK